ncbi:MAG: DUF4860 domain-containing protein [Clostridiales bacterium]|nr:DUF4860 domain-containing protein [Clostridiales bacterium]
MKKAQSSHAISGVFVFLLLGAFAVFATVMVVLGARAYKGSSDRLADHNAERVAAAYVRSMVRANDEAGVIRIEEVDGITALTMETTEEFDVYATRVYVYDGMLREWYAGSDVEFEPDQGEAVCKADEMRAEMNGNLLAVFLRNGEKWITVDTALRAAAQ